MAQRAMQPAFNGSGVQFPPEADGVFDVVTVADIASWREKLNERFGIGKGDYKTLDDADIAR